MLDIDHFKKVNDTYGHNVGDDVLISISKIIQNSIRNNDAFVRFGGEEFFIFLANADLKIAEKIAEKFHALIRNTLHTELNLTITASFGVTEYIEDEDMNTIFKRVDTLLYKAKKTGRDKVISQ